MATRRRICRIRVLAENSPVWRIRVLAKMAILASMARTRYIRQTFANPFPRTRYIRRVRRMYRMYRIYRV